MVKKWIDAGDIKSDNLVNRDKKFVKLMQEVPNFNKREGTKKIYEKDGYIILEAQKGFIVYNTRKEFSKGHSHLHSFNMAKAIIDNCTRKRKPKTDSLYLLNSHIRVSNDDKYNLFIKELIKAKEGKEKLKYRNVNSKKVK